jgi:hypothetical protein
VEQGVPARGRPGAVPHPGRWRAALLFRQRSAANQGLTLILAICTAALILWGLPEMWRAFPRGIDLEIPLYAASRWAAHVQPYPPDAMKVVNAPELPYLYPPFLLPLLSPVASLQRWPVIEGWLLFCDACAIWTCRRIGLPWIAVPFALAWPPFAEGLLTGNIQIWSFAAFAAVFCERHDGALRRRDLVPGRDALNGVLAASVGALKVAQSLPLLFLLKHRPRAAVAGIAALAIVALATLPLVGIGSYVDWIAQLRRAADPAWSWTIGGVAPGRFLHTPDLLFTGIAVGITLAARGRDTVAWLGIALVLVSPSVHGYTFLFMLPALVTIRRDMALPLACLFLGNYMAFSWWIGVALITACLAAMNRWTWLRVAEAEPRSSVAASATAISEGRFRAILRRSVAVALG